MCLGYPAKITETDGRDAKVEYMGIKTQISVELIENPLPGDYIMVHAGIAIAKMKQSEAEETLQMFAEIEGFGDGTL